MKSAWPLGVQIFPCSLQLSSNMITMSAHCRPSVLCSRILPGLFAEGRVTASSQLQGSGTGLGCRPRCLRSQGSCADHVLGENEVPATNRYTAFDAIAS